MNMREKGHRCWILTGCPFFCPIGGWSAYSIPSLYCTLWLHISITVNAAILYVLYIYISIFILVRNVVYVSTWKGIERHMCFISNHLLPWIFITREREVYVSAGPRQGFFWKFGWMPGRQQFQVMKAIFQLRWSYAWALSHQATTFRVDQQRLAVM